MLRRNRLRPVRLVRSCRACGCDDCSMCIRRTGRPCHWVAPDLCSACLSTANDDTEPRMAA
jgi:hypothetical protein